MIDEQPRMNQPANVINNYSKYVCFFLQRTNLNSFVHFDARQMLKYHIHF